MLKQATLHGYLEQLASAAPTPGGGSAAAIACAQGVALLAMVCNLTRGKKKFAAVEDEINRHLDQLQHHLQRSLALAQADIDGFQPVVSAYQLPQQTDAQRSERHRAIQQALKTAAQAPFQLFQLCSDQFPIADRLKTIANPMVASDITVAEHQLVAALYSARANVEINLAGIEDEGFVAKMRGVMETALRAGDYLVRF